MSRRGGSSGVVVDHDLLRGENEITKGGGALEIQEYNQMVLWIDIVVGESLQLLDFLVNKWSRRD